MFLKLKMANKHWRWPSKYRPSLMVIDLNMPVLDGLETIKTFRELEGNGERTPIVAITAYEYYGMEEAALETGCNKYLASHLIWRSWIAL